MSFEYGKFKLIKTSVMPNLTEVRFYEETWAHIKEEHAEFSIELQRVAIETCVIDPTSVHESRSNDASLVFVDTKSTFAGNPLVVPVKIVEGTSGRIQTAYYRGTAYAGTPLWTASNE